MADGKLMTCPFFALLATFSIGIAFICGTAVAMEKAPETKKLTVTVEVFSGRPNPTFHITDPKAINRLRRSLKRLPASLATEEERSEFNRLGYRGIVITNASGIEGIPRYVQLFNGKAKVLGKEGEAANFFTDTAGLEEYYLGVAEMALTEMAQLTLEKRAVDVGDLLRDTQVNFGSQAAHRGVTLALDVPAELPRVTGDRRRIGQVVGYMLTNALRDTPEGGRVTLSAAAGEGVVKVMVADTSAGIPPEDLPNFFERFWRGKESRSRGGVRSGREMTMAIAKGLVEMHGGTIGVESTPGKGSKLWFALPAD